MSQKGTQYGAGEQAYAYETASNRDIKTRQSFACMHAAVMRVRARAQLSLGHAKGTVARLAAAATIKIEDNSCVFRTHCVLFFCRASHIDR